MKKRPQVIAHRGGRQWAPENTLSAFSRSVQAGFDGIELDVQRCASGELVVFHDTDISRTTNGVGLVRDISYDELSRLSAGEWYHDEFRDERVPLFHEVLDLVAGKLTINVEIKNTPVDYPGIEEDLLDVLASYKYKDKIVISSFNHHSLRRVRELDADYKLAVLDSALIVDIKEYMQKFDAMYWHPNYTTLLPIGVEEAHRAGIGVNTWTANNARDWAMLVDWGVDAIITDDPVGLDNFLARYCS